MKTLLLAAIALSCSLTANAQLRTFTKSADTAVNVSTVNLTAPSTGYSKTTTIVLKVVKVSGTVAGTVTVEGSHDNVTYAPISTDTLTLANSSQTRYWDLGEAKMNYYRLVYSSTNATSRSVPTATILFRKD